MDILKNKDLQILCRGFECIEALRFSRGEGEDKGSDNDIPESHKKIRIIIIRR